jgi:hypothetical protein
MIRTPIVAAVSAVLFDFRSSSQQFTQRFPQLKGKLYKDVPFLFPNATVIGLFPSSQPDKLLISPQKGYVMQVRPLISLHSAVCSDAAMSTACA